jgi:hypothetical protein
MNEWIEQKAKDILAWQVIHDNDRLYETMKKDILQALREAEARGMERAAKICDDDDSCSEHAYYFAMIIRKSAGADK